MMGPLFVGLFAVAAGVATGVGIAGFKVCFKRGVAIGTFTAIMGLCKVLEIDEDGAQQILRALKRGETLGDAEKLTVH